MIAFLKDDGKRGMLFVIVSGVALVLSFFLGQRMIIDPAWVAIVLCGLPIIKNAAIALVTEFDIKADILVSLALIAAVIVGEVFAAGEVAFIMTIGAMLEERTVAKARAGIEKLVRLTPRTARVVRGGEEMVIPAEEVRSGDILRVLAGETIAADGVIVEGQTSVDQSVMTGESLPADKGEGDEVRSGTVNMFGTFDMQATRVGEDSSLSRMIRLVESADAGKAKIVGIADRWATWIVVIALVSAAGTWFFTGEIIRAVTILVVFCPCALVLATPTAIMAGIGNATRHGILVSQGDALERLAQIDTVAFDKTGTLTYGVPSVAAVRTFSSELSEAALLDAVASAERRSEHPLGKAIVEYASKTTGRIPADPAEFQMIAGRGVSAAADGMQVLAGNAALMTDRGITLSDEMRAAADEYINSGCTVIYAAINGSPAGIVALSDHPRPDAADVVRELEWQNLRTMLMTGDNASAAGTIAAQTGIIDVISDCLPETKLENITAMRQNGRRVCMVGDGVNDAPALKSAHVGIAMGGIGSDIAIDAADIVLVSDEIRALPHLTRLARRMMGTIRLNLALSMALNFAAILLAMTGILNPVVGALVHNVGSVVVIVNSALLLGWKSKKDVDSREGRAGKPLRKSA